MINYLMWRLLRLPVSLLLLSLFCYTLFALTPTDPVEQYLVQLEGFRGNNEDPTAYERDYARAAAKLGYDRPPFYFSVVSRARPDALDAVVYPGQRKMLERLLAVSGEWTEVEPYYRELRRVAYGPDTEAGAAAVARRLLIQDEPARIRYALDKLEDERLSTLFGEVADGDGRRTELWLPRLRWHGTDNRYHTWLMGLLTGDFGRSYQDNRPVANKIWPALKWTALLNFLAIVVVFAVSIPLGMYAADRRGSWFDRLTTLGLFLLFGIPSFWVATLVTNFFTTPAFGMDFFPSMGVGEVGADAGATEFLRVRAVHLFLPVLCLAYPSWAYVSRHLRRSAVTEFEKPYVKTAAMRGLSRGRIIWGHVFRNASFPLITLTANLLPALLVGSILIERIFNLPGMGQLLYNAANGRDWPVIIALVLLNGLLTALGLLLADLGYALADPRVTLARR